MENQTLGLGDPVGAGAISAQPSSVAASASGSSGAQATTAGRRTPGRWRMISRATPALLPTGGKEVLETSYPSMLHEHMEWAEQTPGAMILMT
jgi:hypothetical protein